MPEPKSTSHLPAPGDVLADKYRIVRTIGRGGMGVVYAATHELLHQTVALKLLLPEVASHPEAISRFLNEARASARIRSEHVATVMDVGTLDDGGAYIVMEYLEGHDLEALLVQNGVMSVEKVVQCVLQALEGIAHAHALGIVHRDLKPSNLFMSELQDGSLSIKVLDFGISKAPRTEADGNATATHVMLGSPLFMSPEQVRSAKNVDARSDLWSLGVIMYRLLTGKVPFVGDSIGEILAAILVQPYAPIGETRRDVPEAFAKVVDRCLERDRDQRYANAAELAIALEPFAGSQSDSVARICRVLGVRRDGPPVALSPRGLSTQLAPVPSHTVAAPPAGSTVEVPRAVGSEVAPPLVGAAPADVPPEVAPVAMASSVEVEMPAVVPTQTVALAGAPAVSDPKLGPSAGPWSAGGEGKRASTRRLPWAALAGGVVLVAVGGAAVALRSSAPPPSVSAAPEATSVAPAEPAPPSPPREPEVTTSSRPTPPAPDTTASIAPAEVLAPLPPPGPAAPAGAGASLAPSSSSSPRPAASASPPRDHRPAASASATGPRARPAPIDSILLQRN